MMKKLFAIILAVSFVFTLATSVFAEDENGENQEVFETVETALEIVCKTSNPYGTYNYGGKVSFEFSLDIIGVPESADGVSVLVFNVEYDETVLALGVKGEADEDEDEFDYSALLRFFPTGWEAFGRDVDGVFEICVWDATYENPIIERSNITVKIPFDVLEDANADTTTVDFTNITLFGEDLTECALLEPKSFDLERAFQPDELVNCPDDAISLDIAGYKHAANNVIYYAEQDITVGDYISSYIEIDNNQDDMNYFAIIIVDPELGEVVYADSVIGRPQSDKSQVLIPAGHYIIGVNGNKQGEFKTFTERLTVGMKVELINVNLTTMDPDEPYVLEEAGFILTYPEPVPNYGANVIFDREASTVYIYENGKTAGDIKTLFKNVKHIYDVECRLLEDDDIVTTGAYIPYHEINDNGVYIVIVGDVNGDGLVDQYDYILVKRHYFETYELGGDYLKAACISNGETIETFDYIYVKRIYFNTLKPEALMHLKEVK